MVKGILRRGWDSVGVKFSQLSLLSEDVAYTRRNRPDLLVKDLPSSL